MKLFKYITVGGFALFGACQMVSSFAATVVSDPRFRAHSSANQSRFSSVDSQLGQKATLRQRATFAGVTSSGLKVNGQVNVTGQLNVHNTTSVEGISSTGSPFTGVYGTGTNNGVYGIGQGSGHGVRGGTTGTGHGVYGTANSANSYGGYFDRLYSGKGKFGIISSPVYKGVTPPQVFGNPTGNRFPLFTGTNNWQWQRPLEVCGSDPATAVFDGKNATVTVNPVTITGGPGSAASVENTGTTADAVFKFTIPQGAHGHVIYCNISSPIRAFAYDSAGSNPQPPLQAFAAQVWHDTIRVIANAYTWWTGGPAQRVFGSATTALFTPSVKPSFSHMSSNNYVAVQVRYSSAETGISYCTTSAPIVATRAGIKGDTGASGSPDTQADILNKIDDASTGILARRTNSADTDVMFKIMDLAGNSRLYVTASGLLIIQDANGKARFAFNTTTNTLKLGNYSASSIRAGATIDSLGQITRYAPNGTTVVYRDYTTGRATWYSKSGRAIMQRYTGALVL